MLELGHVASASYVTKLMADLGADVSKVEEPSGDAVRQRGSLPGKVIDPEQSRFFLFYKGGV